MVRQLDLQPLRNPCPYDGHTKRQDIKEHIRELEKRSPEVYDHLAAAMRNAPNQELWPEQLSQNSWPINSITFGVRKVIKIIRLKLLSVLSLRQQQ